LTARTYGVPAWDVLGAPSARPVLCNGTLGAGEPAVAAARAGELARQGFATLKVKVGSGDDAGRMRAVRAACGPDTKLRVDANGAWDVEEAVAALAALADVALELAEQPCRSLEAMAELRARTEVPLVADESVTDEADAEQAVALGACDAVTLKLAKVGGPHAALRAAAIGPAYLSSALDSPLGIAAAVHTSQAMPAGGFAAGLAQGLATSDLFADNIADATGLAGPAIEAPVSPGLGVEVDPDAVERLRIR